MAWSPDLPTDCSQCDPLALNWGQGAASSPRQLALRLSRFIQDSVNGGDGRVGSLTCRGHTQRTLPAPSREGGGSLFLKNINVFICIITSLGHPAGPPVDHRMGREEGVRAQV